MSDRERNTAASLDAEESSEARRRAGRVRAVSALLLSQPRRLLPLASLYSDEQPVFVSVISGPSMEPAIPRRSRLLVQVLGRRPCQLGDIAFFLSADGYMAHRVVGRARRGVSGQQYLLTCGDNRLAPDAPTSADDVLGRVIAVERSAGWCVPGPLVPGRLHRRLIRAITHAATSATLRYSAAAARRLADLLVEAEVTARNALGRIRRWGLLAR